MIELNNASRWYGQVVGLNDVSCEIGPGVTALLGMNGAGKSTMMRLVTGQIKPTTGTVRISGENPFANPRVYRQVGYCPEFDQMYEDISGREFVIRMARLSGYGASEAAKRAETQLERVGMADRCDKRIAGYSKGMRQRIKLAQALVHDPEIILLDEPLNGLDPVGRRDIMNLVGEFAKQGKTVLVSSHILFEVEQMTRSILLLHRGRLLATGDLEMIRSLIDKYPHRVLIKSPHPRELAQRISQWPFVINLSFAPTGDALELQTREPDHFYDSLPKLVLEEGLSIEGLSSPDNNLESIFKYLVEA